MSCKKFFLNINGQRISDRDPEKKWKEWMMNVWHKLSPAEQKNYERRINENNYMFCFRRRLAWYKLWRLRKGAKCLPTSWQSRQNRSYQTDCVKNNPIVQNTLGRFYDKKPDSVANYHAIFDTKKALADSEILEIKNIVGSFPRAMTDLQIEIESKKREIRGINNRIRSLEHKTEAQEQQFVDDKKASGKTVKKQKLNVLQDYLLAAFFIGYLFFGLVAIFYVSKINDYSWKIFGLMTLLVVIVGGLMTAVVNYVG